MCLNGWWCICVVGYAGWDRFGVKASDDVDDVIVNGGNCVGSANAV